MKNTRVCKQEGVSQSECSDDLRCKLTHNQRWLGRTPDSAVFQASIIGDMFETRRFV